MSTFAATFRELVIPDLTRMIAARGLFLALGLSGWSEAYDEVLDEASRRGALHLPDAVFRQLEDWISDELLKASTAAEPLAQRAAAASDKALWRCILERPWPTTRR